MRCDFVQALNQGIDQVDLLDPEKQFQASESKEDAVCFSVLRSFPCVLIVSQGRASRALNSMVVSRNI